MLEVLLVATLTALATGVGVLPVWALGARAEHWRPALTGFAGGAMAIAAVFGLAKPAAETGSALQVVVGLGGGIAFLLGARAMLGRRDGAAGGRGSAAVIFAVLLVHSLPEGFAIGTAYASDQAGLGLFVVVAIGIQNIPEGTGVALPMEAAGVGTLRQVAVAIGSSIPQPIGAAIAFVLVEEVSGLLPLSFAFAAGAMAALVVAELGPARRHASGWATGFAIGAGLMLGTGAVAGV